MSIKEDYVMIFPESFKAKVKKLFPNCEEMDKRLENGDGHYVISQIEWNLENAIIKETPEYLSTSIGKDIHKSFVNLFNSVRRDYEMIQSNASSKELEKISDEFDALYNTK